MHFCVYYAAGYDGDEFDLQTGAHPRGRGCTDFLYTTISNVLCDFPFSRNQPLKSADDEYIRILKNVIKSLKCLK
jgi:hypothetical protein